MIMTLWIGQVVVMIVLIGGTFIAGLAIGDKESEGKK